MNIAIDLRSLEQGSIQRGIGSYIYNLLWSISRIDNHNIYYLFAYSDQSEYIIKNLPHSHNFNFVFLPRPQLRKKKFIRTLVISNSTLVISKQLDINVIFQLDTMFPIRIPAGVKVVTVVHDLIPFLHKEKYMQIKLHHNTVAGIIVLLKDIRRHQLLEHSVKQHNCSDNVIVISKSTANDLVSYSGISNNKLKVIYHGTTILHNKNLQKPHTKIPAKYIFYVGGNDPRKNICNFLVDVAETLKRYNLNCVLAGKELTNMQVPETKKLRAAAKKLDIADRIITPGFVTDEELAWLYEHALAFVFPSRYEGFGLPVLEAMQAGCPVIAYSNSSIPEVAGNAALLIKDGESMTPAIERLLTEKDLREDLIKKGKKQASKFSWEKTAKETIKVLEEVGRI